MGYGIYNFSTPHLLREGRGTDLVIRSNVVSQHVISTLYLKIALLRIGSVLYTATDQLDINFHQHHAIYRQQALWYGRN